jgi:glutamate-ammonia-ligase adenylyltransferase
VENKWSVLAERAPELAAMLIAAPGRLGASAARVLDGSDFIADALLRDERLLPLLLERAPQDLAGPLPLAAYRHDPGDEGAFMSALRRWRHAEQVRIAWRDLAGWASLAETLGDLSAAADGALRSAHDFALATLAARHGAPLDAAQQVQPLLIVAMGKLGGQELNFSSDIDLVFLYATHGETTGARPLAHEEFYTRLGQMLIRTVDAATPDGRAWRVDMRLRPFGASGPLAASVSAFEDYLESHGRDWERYAWVKARAVTGIDTYEQVFRNAVQPFVYRRYLDFGVFESLREMKALISREVERRELNDNIKLGYGGIREIEFIVQSMQLVRGGSERRLQSSSLLQTLPRLAGARLLPEPIVAELSAAYAFLRRLENRLQMYGDQQTHQLPAEPLAQQRIARAMGCGSWDELATALETHRQRVSAAFEAVVQGDGQGGPARPAPSPAPALPEPAAQLLQDLRASALMRRLDETGRRRLEALLAVLVAELAPAPDALELLRRLLRIIEAIGARSTYFALLLENSAARTRLIELTRHGDFLPAQIAAYPLLLDELIDERLLQQLPARAQLAAELQQLLAEVDAGDEERLVQQLRHFQRAALFRIAVADLGGRLALMQVSDRLTELAELIVEAALLIAWRFVTQQYGTPECGTGSARRAVRICAVGYGKLGGMELGYSSDLDLVFLHDSIGAEQQTVGARSVDNQVFFVRFVQRLVHLLTMHSAAGRLYEVDMRLRPSGKGGMLITSIEAFEDYQRQEAWTWEHQALLHARSMAGDPQLRERFEELRLRVLQQCVRRDTLRADVAQMRLRMRNELSAAASGQFDLKQDPGGIADIEFLAQYWTLLWAGQYPPLAWFADTIRELESLSSAALVPQVTIDVLTAAYRAYRECSHHRSIAGLPPLVPEAQFLPERAAVTAIWNSVMEV